jgi:hypothetical protein
VGSQSKINLAYIAGFLDGDGSLMLQIKKRTDGKLGRRFMATICFYQDSRHEKPLYWIRNYLKIGYISKRNDNITELRINGFEKIRETIKNLLPFIKFKKKQADALFKATSLLVKRESNLKKKELLKIVNYMMIIQNNNYITKRKKTKSELLNILGLTP